MLKSALPHEMQTEPHSSLPLIPRPPIDGEPNECKQEAVDSIVTAGRMNRMVETAEPQIADVDRTALLGGEPAERVHIVDKGDETECEPQARLQQTNFLCGGICQCSENANETVPIANGLPLKGEWTVYASGEASDPRSNENASNAAVEDADASCEQVRLAEVDGVKSESCEGGTDGRASADERRDTLNELTELLTQTVELYVENGGDILHMYLGGTHWRVDDTNGPGNKADTSKGQADVSRARADTSDGPNNTETDVMGHGKGAETYLSPGGTKRGVRETDSVGSHADALTGQTDALGVEMNATKPADKTEIVRMHRNRSKPRNSPHTLQNETFKRIYRWRTVSVGDGGVYIPLNAPIETASRTFAFGRLESGEEAIAPRDVEGERAVEGDGDRDGDDGGVGDLDDTTSGGDVDSKRVKAALLAGDSQRMRQNRRTRNGDLPMSSVPPIRLAERPNGLTIRRRRRGRIKIEPIKVNPAQEVEMTYRIRARAAQPPANDPACRYGVHTPRRQRGRIKTEPRNVSQTRNSANAYLGRVNAMRSTWRPKKGVRRVKVLTFAPRIPGEPWHEDGRLEIEYISVNQAGEDETTYRGCA